MHGREEPNSCYTLPSCGGQEHISLPLPPVSIVAWGWWVQLRAPGAQIKPARSAAPRHALLPLASGVIRAAGSRWLSVRGGAVPGREPSGPALPRPGERSGGGPSLPGSSVAGYRGESSSRRAGTRSRGRLPPRGLERLLATGRVTRASRAWASDGGRKRRPRCAAPGGGSGSGRGPGHRSVPLPLMARLFLLLPLP